MIAEVYLMAKTDKGCYGRIRSVEELENLAANAEQGHAVGITENGGLYILNEINKPESITPDRAISILGVTQEELTEIIKSRGELEIERFTNKVEESQDTATADEIIQDEQEPVPVAQDAEEAKIEAEDEESKQEVEEDYTVEPETVTISKERYDELIECEAKKDEALEDLRLAKEYIHELEKKQDELDAIKAAAKTIATLFQ